MYTYIHFRNFQSFDAAPPVSVNQTTYASNPYLNPSASYMGEMYVPSNQQDKAYGNTGEDFEDEPPLLEGLHNFI